MTLFLHKIYPLTPACTCIVLTGYYAINPRSSFKAFTTRSTGRTRAAIMYTASFILHSKRKLAFLVALGKNVLISILCTHAKSHGFFQNLALRLYTKGTFSQTPCTDTQVRKVVTKTITNTIKTQYSTNSCFSKAKFQRPMFIHNTQMHNTCQCSCFHNFLFQNFLQNNV